MERSEAPAGYGRVLTEGTRVVAIREEKDATPEERAVRLCNAGLMALSGAHALALLERIGTSDPVEPIADRAVLLDTFDLATFSRAPARFALERTVRACAVAAESEAQFVRQMRRANLLVHPRFAAGTDSVVTGYSVAERPPKGMRPLWFGGGKLAQDLTLPSLRTRWPDTPESAQEASE